MQHQPCAKPLTPGGDHPHRSGWQPDSDEFPGYYETERKVYQATSTLLETVDTCYNGSASPCTGTAVNPPIGQRAVTITLPGLSPAETVTAYNGYGLPTEVDEYDYGPTLVPKTLTSYAALGNNIVDHPASVTVQNASGTTVAQTTFAYDQNGVTATSGTPQHVSVCGSRGNLTELSLSTGGSPSTLSRTFTYFDTGEIQTGTDVNGNSTSFSYGACGNSFPSIITSPLSLTQSLAWNCNGGVVASLTDANSQTVSFTYDPLWRLTSTSAPDTGQVQSTYNDAPPASVVMTTKLIATASRTDTVLLDSLGRVSQTQLNSDPAGTDYTAMSYDSLGRLASVSNPYSSTSDATYGKTRYAYDALGRVTTLTYPDNNMATVTYSANCATAVDPKGKGREVCTDALGRVTEVVEDPNGIKYQTTYTYDALNNLTAINQSGQTRSYQYDALSRLTSVTAPESGTTNFYYATPGGTLCSGDLSTICRRMDARGITMTYTYDALNRLTSKSYCDGTPPANFFYDSNFTTIGNWTQSSLQNVKGRLMATCTSNAIATYLGGYTAAVYSYDLAGDLASWMHPAGFTISNAINTAQQITQITSTLSDSTHPGTLATISHTPWGAIRSLTNGCVGTGCTEVQETYDYNNRLQLVRIQLGTAANPAADYCLVYNYYYPSLGTPASCGIPAQAAANDNGDVGAICTRTTPMRR